MPKTIFSVQFSHMVVKVRNFFMNILHMWIFCGVTPQSEATCYGGIANIYESWKEILFHSREGLSVGVFDCVRFTLFHPVSGYLSPCWEFCVCLVLLFLFWPFAARYQTFCKLLHCLFQVRDSLTDNALSSAAAQKKLPVYNCKANISFDISTIIYISYRLGERKQ